VAGGTEGEAVVEREAVAEVGAEAEVGAVVEDVDPETFAKGPGHQASMMAVREAITAPRSGPSQFIDSGQMNQRLRWWGGDVDSRSTSEAGCGDEGDSAIVILFAV
jgi:hypothetical protein